MPLRKLKHSVSLVISGGQTGADQGAPVPDGEDFISRHPRSDQNGDGSVDEPTKDDASADLLVTKYRRHWTMPLKNTARSTLTA